MPVGEGGMSRKVRTCLMLIVGLSLRVDPSRPQAPDVMDGSPNSKRVVALKNSHMRRRPLSCSHSLSALLQPFFSKVHARPISPAGS